MLGVCPSPRPQILLQEETPQELNFLWGSQGRGGGAVQGGPALAVGAGGQLSLMGSSGV